MRSLLAKRRDFLRRFFLEDGLFIGFLVMFVLFAFGTSEDEWMMFSSVRSMSPIFVIEIINFKLIVVWA